MDMIPVDFSQSFRLGIVIALSFYLYLIALNSKKPHVVGDTLVFLALAAVAISMMLF